MVYNQTIGQMESRSESNPKRLSPRISISLELLPGACYHPFYILDRFKLKIKPELPELFEFVMFGSYSFLPRVAFSLVWVEFHFVLKR